MLVGVSDAINKVTLNSKTGEPSIAIHWIRALDDERILVGKAGFLFKASLCENHLMLAVEPCLINGERSYHYNMSLEQEDAYTLIGYVNARGVFTILFRAESPELSVRQIEMHSETFRRFAGFLLEAGYAGEGLLDEVTQTVLKKLEFLPVPSTLFELYNPA